MFTYRMLAVATFILVACRAAPLFAIPTYQYRFDQSNYSVAPSGTVPVNVYLRENFNLGDTTLLDSEGLFGTGVRVQFNVPALPSQPAQILAPGDISFNALFDGFSLIDYVPADSGGFTASIGFSSPPVNGTPGPGFLEILLGTVTITAGSAAGQITNIRAIDFGPSDDNVTNGSLTVLDALIANGNATITVQGAAIVPEPATWALWLLTGITCVIGSRQVWLRALARRTKFASASLR